MASGSREVPFWTLFGLFMAFIDLFIVYILLCVSAFLFFPFKVLSFIALSLPCPCTGFFGYQSGYFCWHKLLIDWPIRRIIYVQELIKSSFPFGLIFLRDQGFNLEVDGKRGPNWGSSGDRGSGYEAKGKRVMYQKQKYGIRRRRRASLGDGRHSTGSGTNDVLSLGTVGAFGSEISECLGHQSGREYGLLDVANATNGINGSESILHCLGCIESYGEEGEIKGVSSSQNFQCNDEGRFGGVGNDENTRVMLEKALQEEKAVQAALYQELEKERAAAATAADEAMAMILRLQEDKASIEMETRQYQRMIEEKFSYDEEEIDILKEILVRREKANHLLEKELEAYRQIDSSSSEDCEADLSYKGHKRGHLNLNNLKETSVLIQQHIDKNNYQAVTTDAILSSNESCSLAFQNEMAEQKDLALDLFASRGLLQRTFGSLGKTLVRDSNLTSQGLNESGACGGDGELPDKDQEYYNEEGGDKHPDQIDTDSTVLDIHVVDDKSIIWKEDDQRTREQLSRAVLDSGTCSFEVQRDYRSATVATIEPTGSASNDLERNSMHVIADERLKVYTEVEWLRERLQAMQEETKHLSLSAQQRDRVNARLKLMEEIVNQFSS